MVSVTDSSLGDVASQGLCFAELSEPNLLLLEPVDYLPQHVLIWAIEYFTISVCRKACFFFFFFLVGEEGRFVHLLTCFGAHEIINLCMSEDYQDWTNISGQISSLICLLEYMGYLGLPGDMSSTAQLQSMQQYFHSQFLNCFLLKMDRGRPEAPQFPSSLCIWHVGVKPGGPVSTKQWGRAWRWVCFGVVVVVCVGCFCLVWCWFFGFFFFSSCARKTSISKLLIWRGSWRRAALALALLGPGQRIHERERARAWPRVSCHGAWQALEASAPLGTAPRRARASCGSPGLSAWLPNTESGENCVVVQVTA